MVAFFIHRTAITLLTVVFLMDKTLRKPHFCTVLALRMITPSHILAVFISQKTLHFKIYSLSCKATSR